MSDAPKTLDGLLDRIRAPVREAHTYLVDTPSGIEVKVNQNESPFDVPGELKERILERTKQLAWNRYPSEFADRLRTKIEEVTGHPAEGVIVGNGSNELTYLLALATVDPGTPVVLPTPMFSLYEKVVRLHEGRIVQVPPREDLRFDADALVEAVRAHEPALVVLTSPNNPTGRAMTIEEIERIVEASPRGFVVVDEAYVQFTDRGTALDLVVDHPQVLVLRTFSKGYGLAGLRVGYLAGAPEVVEEFRRARLPFMIDPIAEETACTLLEHGDLLESRIERLKNGREELFEQLQIVDGVDPVPSEANFVIFRTNLESGALVEKLARRNVLLRDVSGYPELAGYVRVNAGTPSENKAFLAALKNALGNRDPAS